MTGNTTPPFCLELSGTSSWSAPDVVYNFFGSFCRLLDSDWWATVGAGDQRMVVIVTGKKVVTDVLLCAWSLVGKHCHALSLYLLQRNNMVYIAWFSPTKGFLLVSSWGLIGGGLEPCYSSCVQPPTIFVLKALVVEPIIGLIPLFLGVAQIKIDIDYKTGLD